MTLIDQFPEENFWHKICQEHDPPPVGKSESTSTTQEVRFSAATHNPVFCGSIFATPDNIDVSCVAEHDSSVSHPSLVGYALLPNEPSVTSLDDHAPQQSVFESSGNSARDYLKQEVFPTLLPALEQLLRQAEEEQCFVRKRTKFNALDFLTEYLYRKNPIHHDDRAECLWDIPFVQGWIKDHPRKPLPLSLVWSSEEASLVIQKHYRGFKARTLPEVQELRQWQREWRNENRNIRQAVDEFWTAKGVKEDDTDNDKKEDSKEKSDDVEAKPDTA